jgi:hypothetical protein
MKLCSNVIFVYSLQLITLNKRQILAEKVRYFVNPLGTRGSFPGSKAAGA